MAMEEYKQQSDSGMMFVLGIVVVIILLVVFWVWGLPALRTERSETVIDITQEVIEVTPTPGESVEEPTPEAMEETPTPVGEVNVNLQY